MLWRISKWKNIEEMKLTLVLLFQSLVSFFLFGPQKEIFWNMSCTRSSIWMATRLKPYTNIQKYHVMKRTPYRKCLGGNNSYYKALREINHIIQSKYWARPLSSDGRNEAFQSFESIEPITSQNDSLFRDVSKQLWRKEASFPKRVTWHLQHEINIMSALCYDYDTVQLAYSKTLVVECAVWTFYLRAYIQLNQLRISPAHPKSSTIFIHTVDFCFLSWQIMVCHR